MSFLAYKKLHTSGWCTSKVQCSSKSSPCTVYMQGSQQDFKRGGGGGGGGGLDIPVNGEIKVRGQV